MGPLRDAVGAGYFRTLGIPILLGRDFETRDDEKAPKVAIVNESFAKFYFGAANPLGKRIGDGGQDKPDIEIVGVAKDSKYSVVREKTPRFWYVPYEQLFDDATMRTTLHVRTAGDPDHMIAGLRDAIWSVDSKVAIDNVTTLETQVEEHLSLERLVAALLSFFGILAALLASVGLYGVLAFSTARRRREIGVRLALGAEPARVRRLVLRDAAVQAIAGIAIGLPAGLAVSRLLESQLFGVSTTDPLSIAAATVLLAVVALAAGDLPARRASRVDPAIVLRCDG
jgi:predicted permease